MSLPSTQLIQVTEASTEVEALLTAHHSAMRAQSPEQSCHVMTGEALRATGAEVFALISSDGAVLAVGAFKTVAAGGEPQTLDGVAPVVELKSMHVAAKWRRHGLGHLLLSEMLVVARGTGATGACLETGTAPEFTAARALYLSQGFAVCPPFSDYTYDPLSVFMCRRL